jgi:hypothetical protein
VEAPERDRRVAVLIHAAMLLSVVVYGGVVAFYRITVVPDAVPPPRLDVVFAAMAGLSVVQLAGAAIAARAILRSRRGEPAGRIRASFLVRGAAAEGIAIYAFAIGFLGAPASRVLALFGLGIAALVACAPTRAAWSRAAGGASEDRNAVSPR